MNSSELVMYLSLASLILHFVAQAIVIFTKTPDPTTTLGKIYELVEIVAGLVGHAKDVFTPENPPEE